MPRISALPATTQLTGEDEIAVVDVSDSSTKKATIDTIMPTGSIMDFAGSTAPSGWLLCYGQALDANTNPQYQALYDVIGNTYGGSDYTDFVVPDLRGRVLAGKDDMGGSSANRLTDQSGGLNGDVLGDSGGAERHQLTVAELASHSHRQVVTHTGGVPGRRDYDSDGGVSSYDQGVNTYTTGSNTPHNNVQPTIITNKIIKY